MKTFILLLLCGVAMGQTKQVCPKQCVDGSMACGCYMRKSLDTDGIIRPEPMDVPAVLEWNGCWQEMSPDGIPDEKACLGIANDCGTNSYLQCAFDVSPYPFFCAVLGICLYAYGYLGARVGYGYGWLNLSAFGIGFLLSIYGIFQILETIREVRQIAM